MKTPSGPSMSDIPEDLTSVGTHHGNQPPTETGQEVRSPEGPDPSRTPSEPSPALFQVVRNSEEDWIQIRVHSPRAQVQAPDNGSEEVGQYRTVSALRTALETLSIGGQTAVFEDAEAEQVFTDSDVSPDHSWIGQPQYERITFVANDDAASAYLDRIDRPSSQS